MTDNLMKGLLGRCSNFENMKAFGLTPGICESLPHEVSARRAANRIRGGIRLINMGVYA